MANIRNLVLAVTTAGVLASGAAFAVPAMVKETTKVEKTTHDSGKVKSETTVKTKKLHKKH